jgi:hypothetical protein
MHLDATYLGLTSRRNDGLRSDTSLLRGSLSSFVDLHTPDDLAGEQTILLERVAGEMEKKRLSDAASQFLPFLADAIEEVGTRLTPTDAWSMNESIISLLRLPDYFGDATYRIRITDLLEAAKEREIEIPLKIRRDVPGSVDSLEPRWWIEPSPDESHLVQVAT